MSDYLRRVVDIELDELLPGLPAISLEGPKGVGKTVTALRRANTVRRFDDPVELTALLATPRRIVEGPPPVLIDEWQRYPPSWDLVRRAVDDGRGGGRFLLTGSMPPVEWPMHSGSGRIVSMRMRMRMRPLGLSERALVPPTVSLKELLTRGSTGDFRHLTPDRRRLCRGDRRIGPARPADGDRSSAPDPTRRLPRPHRRTRLGRTGYGAAGPGRDAEVAPRLRRGDRHHRNVRDDPRRRNRGRRQHPARSTTIAYRRVLEQLWIVDPVPAWLPTFNHIARIAAPAKHHLADPALAARLLGADVAALLTPRPIGPPAFRDGPLLGRLFESLVTLGIRVCAQAAEAKVRHLRTRAGTHEIDLIVERADQRVVAVEVKPASLVNDRDVRHLHWLGEQIGPDLLDKVVITIGPEAYRRQDGVVVVPAALLGP